MNLFDQLVNNALNNNPELSPLRVVVEKELLHHDILRTLSDAKLLTELTFIGGTCLRTCYGSKRLSEDLDFTGGAHFERNTLVNLSQILIDSLQAKYGLQVKIKDPTREEGNVDTWSLQIQTRPGRKDLPAQRINIDICAIPSYDPRPMGVLNPYGVEMGTGGLILQAESREEIFADKMLAFALRPNRVKHRDLWDIFWLHQQGIVLPVNMIADKIEDHRRNPQEFSRLLKERLDSLSLNTKLSHEFNQEMVRFLPYELHQKISEQENFWKGIVETVHLCCEKIQASL